MNTIVVLTKGNIHKEDRSWACHSPGEADALAKWLNDNWVEAEAMTAEAWEKLS